MRRPAGLSLSESFQWFKPTRQGDCLVWPAAKTTAGYGQFRYKGAALYAHVVAWEMVNGPVPPGKELDHRCRNRACVNHKHLRPTTRKQNLENASLSSANTSGMRGVSWHKASSKWTARVAHGGHVYAKYFASKEEAAVAVVAMRNSLYTHNDVDKEFATA